MFSCSNSYRNFLANTYTPNINLAFIRCRTYMRDLNFLDIF